MTFFLFIFRMSAIDFFYFLSKKKEFIVSILYDYFLSIHTNNKNLPVVLPELSRALSAPKSFHQLWRVKKTKKKKVHTTCYIQS